MNVNSTRRPAYSRCAARSRQKEVERLRRLSVEERIRLALTMDRRFAWMSPVVSE
jgi:hypothetical protein